MSSMTGSAGRFPGPLGFSDGELLPEKLGNALSLEIDESRRRGVEIEAGGKAGREASQVSSLPKFTPHNEIAHERPNTFSLERENAFPNDVPFTAFGSSPARGRGTQPGPEAERELSGESRNSNDKSRISLDNPTVTTGRQNLSGSMFVPLSPERVRDVHAHSGVPRGPGPIGGPAAFDPRLMGQQPYGGPLPPHLQYAGVHSPSRSTGFTMGSIGGGPPSPVRTTHPISGRQAPGYAAYHGSGQIGAGPPMGGFYTSGPHFSPPEAQFSYQSSYFSQVPGSPHNPTTSPSFSSLSLTDLGKGLPIPSLAPNTPLYIVSFKAGRRDVYYCPDPTLLISNGDRVIVEADRGSDLGTVVYDQLTPVDVREWQEKQATAALLSGASHHQPPGMAVINLNPPTITKPRVSGLGGDAGEADLHALLSGVGPSGQLDVGQLQSRGPLAKEVMPKRIFAKSSQGPEEQA